jgi:hypothetical protein
MQTSGWLQLALYLAALAAITKPMGLYLMQVLDAPNGKTWFDPVEPAPADSGTDFYCMDVLAVRRSRKGA